eukprot:1633686-Rhodomonas_salina.1
MASFLASMRLVANLCQLWALLNNYLAGHGPRILHAGTPQRGQLVSERQPGTGNLFNAKSCKRCCHERNRDKRLLHVPVCVADAGSWPILKVCLKVIRTTSRAYPGVRCKLSKRRMDEGVRSSGGFIDWAGGRGSSFGMGGLVPRLKKPWASHVLPERSAGLQ